MGLRWDVPLSFLYPPFGHDLTTVFRGAPMTFAVIKGYVPRVEQEARWLAYRRDEGPATAPPGRSAHEHGCAVHLVPLDAAGALDWAITNDGWRWMAEHLFPLHPSLVHGRDKWRWSHIEWRAWKEVMWGHLKRR